MYLIGKNTPIYQYSLTMEFLSKDNLKFFTIEHIDFISQDQPFLQNTRTHKLFFLESIKPQKLSELAKLYNILLAIEHQIVSCALASKKFFFPSYASEILCPGNNAKSDIHKLPDIFL